MNLNVDLSLRKIFPDLEVLTGRIANVKVKPFLPELDAFKEEIMQEIRRRYNLESIKDNPTFRAYRDFLWRIKVDPTKTRPAAEALIRRVLGGRTLPVINSLVDSFNLASMKSEIALATFDADKLKGSLLLRFAVEGEEFLGIGMAKPIRLTGNEVIVCDEEKLVAIYPYRDAEASKITEDTRNVLLLVCGVPGIGEEKLRMAMDTALEFVMRFCGGTVKPV